MKIKCTAARGEQLPASYVDQSAGFGRDAKFHLKLQKEYDVVALTLRQGGVWYYVEDESGREYPIWYPAPLFALTDNRLSRYWRFGFTDGGLRDGSVVFAFPEWANDPADYYDRLTDKEPRAMQVYRAYRELLVLEYRSADTQNAVTLEGGWLQCPNCAEAWNADLRGELVRCPKCRLIWGNPVGAVAATSPAQLGPRAAP